MCVEGGMLYQLSYRKVECGVWSRSRTDGFTALQAVALDHSAIHTYHWRAR
jgi:hypothetical protein